MLMVFSCYEIQCKRRQLAQPDCTVQLLLKLCSNFELTPSPFYLSKDVFLCTSICITSCHVYVGVCVRVQACQFPPMLIKGELRRSLAIRGMVIDVESSVGYKV